MFINELNISTVYFVLELKMCILGGIYPKMAMACKILTVITTCIKCKIVKSIGVFIGEHVLHVKSCTKFSLHSMWSLDHIL